MTSASSEAAGPSPRPTALVTGASSGIGRELAAILAREGHDLVIVARRREALDALAQEVRAARGTRVTVTVISADLGRDGAASEVQERLAADGVTVDVLVNNAGVGSWGFFHENDLDRELEMIHLNVLALTDLTHRMLPGMIARKRGRVLNVGSVAGFQPGPRMAVYYATKAYVLSFSQALANELSGTGVTVTALCPGPVPTEFQASAGIEGARLMSGSRLLSAAAVAEAGYRAMVKGKVLCIPGAANWILAQGNRFVPRRFATAVARFLQERRT